MMPPNAFSVHHPRDLSCIQADLQSSDDERQHAALTRLAGEASASAEPSSELRSFLCVGAGLGDAYGHGCTLQPDGGVHASQRISNPAEQRGQGVWGPLCAPLSGV